MWGGRGQLQHQLWGHQDSRDLCSVLELEAARGSVHSREPRTAILPLPLEPGWAVGSCSPWEMLGMHPTITMWIR